MKYTVLVVADFNDADYVQRMETIDEKDLKLIKKVIAAINTYEEDYSKPWRGNWDTEFHYSKEGESYFTVEKMYDSSIISRDEVLAFTDSFLPFIDNQDIHSIKCINITPVIEWEELYRHKYYYKQWT